MAIPEVRDYLPERVDGSTCLKTVEVRFSRRSLSIGDVPLRLGPGDVDGEFLVRLPWGYTAWGGFVFYVRLENLTEDHAIFKTLYHVGRLDDGSRVYAYKGFGFNLRRDEVYGRRVVRGAEGGPVTAKADAEVPAGARPALP